LEGLTKAVNLSLTRLWPTVAVAVLANSTPTFYLVAPLLFDRGTKSNAAFFEKTTFGFTGIFNFDAY
jgi:hypothetical protein